MIRYLNNAPAAGAAHDPSPERILRARDDARAFLPPLDLKLNQLPGRPVNDGRNTILKAIAIRNADGVKIGYVPQADNVIFARLMDAGKAFVCRVTKTEWKNQWFRIEAKVSMIEW